MTAPSRALVWSALALAVACGLEQGGQAEGEGDASAGAGGSVTTGGAWGSGGTAGSAGADASLGGVAGVSLGGSAGAAGAPSGGAAGLGGAAGGGGTGTGGLGTGGAATGGTGGGCSAPGTSCGDDSVCCSNLCGPGLAKDVNDCNTFAKCAECDDDGQCGSGRCDACKCEARLAPPSPCNENSDCQSDKCGPGTAKDPNDCNTFAKCAECDADGQCGSGRCDACKCEPRLAVGAACNEGSDCLGDRCGPGPVADYMDCNTYGKCAECDADGQCGSGRCDTCKCEPKLADGSVCNEDSDCVNGWCSGGKCK